MHLDPFPGLCVGPPAMDAAARKDERVRSVTINHGEFQFAVEWRVGYSLLRGPRLGRRGRERIDPGHTSGASEGASCRQARRAVALSMAAPFAIWGAPLPLTNLLQELLRDENAFFPPPIIAIRWVRGYQSRDSDQLHRARARAEPPSSGQTALASAA
jgi:hypothetical protein